MQISWVGDQLTHSYIIARWICLSSGLALQYCDSQTMSAKCIKCRILYFLFENAEITGKHQGKLGCSKAISYIFLGYLGPSLGPRFLDVKQKSK